MFTGGNTDAPIQNWLSKHRTNLPHRPQPEILIAEPVSFYEWYRDKDFLYQEYVVNQRSTSQIAGAIGCARSTVAKALLDFEIPLRDYLPKTYYRGQIAFGQKIRDGKVVPHLGELEIVAKLAEMRASGASYGALVKWVNEHGIKTKNGVKQWDRPTGFKILKRHSTDDFPSDALISKQT